MDSFPDDFDLIIGNPPFDAKLTLPAKEVERNALQERIASDLKQGVQKKGKITKLPDNQIALLFLEQSVKLCKSSGLVCLIQPSGPFLYNNSSAQFRRLLFEKYHIPQIIDFTHISRILFGKNGDVATVAVFIKNEDAKEKGVLHVTVRRTKPHKEKLYFELDTYDFHHVPRKLALNDPLIWKSNFIGGARVHQLVSRFKFERTLGQFLTQKTKSDNWIIREGFKTGKQSEINELIYLKSMESDLSFSQNEQLQKLDKKFTQADFLTGKNTLQKDGLKDYGIDRSKIQKLENTYFLRDWVKQPKIFESPHLLIGEVAGKSSIPIDFVNEFLSFKSQIIGVHAPENGELIEIANRLRNNKFYLFYLAGVSGRYMVNKSTSILKGDIDSLPYPEKNIIDFSLQDEIIINDTVDHLIEFKQKGETSKIAIQNVSSTELRKYGTVYCEILGKIYPTIKPHQYFETSSYICFPFYFGDKEPEIDFTDSNEADKHIESLVRKNLNLNLRLNRIVRMYERNVIYLIKPKKLRYWLQSIALRDADETFVDLRKQGY